MNTLIKTKERNGHLLATNGAQIVVIAIIELLAAMGMQA